MKFRLEWQMTWIKFNFWMAHIPKRVYLYVHARVCACVCQYVNSCATSHSCSTFMLHQPVPSVDAIGRCTRQYMCRDSADALPHPIWRTSALYNCTILGQQAISSVDAKSRPMQMVYFRVCTFASIWPTRNIVALPHLWTILSHNSIGLRKALGEATGRCSRQYMCFKPAKV